MIGAGTIAAVDAADKFVKFPICGGSDLGGGSGAGLATCDVKLMFVFRGGGGKLFCQGGVGAGGGGVAT